MSFSEWFDGRRILPWFIEHRGGRILLGVCLIIFGLVLCFVRDVERFAYGERPSGPAGDSSSGGAGGTSTDEQL